MTKNATSIGIGVLRYSTNGNLMVSTLIGGKQIKLKEAGFIKRGCQMCADIG